MPATRDSNPSHDSLAPPCRGLGGSGSDSESRVIMSPGPGPTRTGTALSDRTSDWQPGPGPGPPLRLGLGLVTRDRGCQRLVTDSEWHRHWHHVPSHGYHNQCRAAGGRGEKFGASPPGRQPSGARVAAAHRPARAWQPPRAGGPGPRARAAANLSRRAW